MKFRLTLPRFQTILPAQLQGKSLLVSLEMSDTTIQSEIIKKTALFIFTLFYAKLLIIKTRYYLKTFNFLNSVKEGKQ
jgi:hypothetical protein